VNFIVLHTATTDVERTSGVYNTKPGRYGAAFENEVDRAFDQIAANPRLYSPCEDGIAGYEFREYFIERFDQRVIYLVRGNDVLVVAVVHASRQEGAWQRNLPEDLIS
jgi:plasmid stabilization system protein ParE